MEKEILKDIYLPKEETVKKKLPPMVKRYEKKRSKEQLKVETLVLDDNEKPDTSKLTDRQMKAVSGFRKYRGNITLATKYAGCSRDTFYRWMNENKVFAHLAERARQESGDTVENKLWERIDRGDPWAIQFWLKHNHPAYAEKLQVQVKALTPSWATKMKLPAKAPLKPYEVMGLERQIGKVIKDQDKKTKSELDAALGTATVPGLPAPSVSA